MDKNIARDRKSIPGSLYIIHAHPFSITGSGSLPTFSSKTTQLTFPQLTAAKTEIEETTPNMA